ncbi:hypothetical protein ACQP00_00640 [Dactylosporangium sp. CS-047395]|jgi:hypothetical protein|uniref:hypothetical protein n=1 Tax=Dactylosporangium sp. CS-047395 TaxID=3239936 RepID=UPI003D8B6358
MHTWWVVLGLSGAGASLGILLVQVLFWQRLRRVGTDPVGIFTQGVALRWVGVPLAVLHMVLFLLLTRLDQPGWWLGGVVTVLSVPVRRLLNLRAITVIVRGVGYEHGPVVDRDGADVARQRYRQLVLSWYRHEYTGHRVGDVIAIKILGLLVHLLFWPIAALGAQASHVLMCQDPADALGHSTDGHERPGDGFRTLGTPYVRFAARDPR